MAEHFEHCTKAFVLERREVYGYLSILLRCTYMSKACQLHSEYLFKFKEMCVQIFYFVIITLSSLVHQMHKEVEK